MLRGMEKETEKEKERGKFPPSPPQLLIYSESETLTSPGKSACINPLSCEEDATDF